MRTRCWRLVTQATQFDIDLDEYREMENEKENEVPVERRREGGRRRKSMRKER